VTTLRRLAHSPLLDSWHLEALCTALLMGGVVAMVIGY
jgi:hypothetical protein